MRIAATRLALSLALAGLALTTEGLAGQVEVFTDQAHPVANADAFPNVTIVRVDALPNTLDRLSEGLPADPKAAAEIANQRLADTDRETIRRNIEGLARARLDYGLDRYPAIVFDGQAVIYGVTDLAVARRYYEQWRDGL